MSQSNNDNIQTEIDAIIKHLASRLTSTVGQEMIQQAQQEAEEFRARLAKAREIDPNVLKRSVTF